MLKHCIHTVSLIYLAPHNDTFEEKTPEELIAEELGETNRVRNWSVVFSFSCLS